MTNATRGAALAVWVELLRLQPAAKATATSVRTARRTVLCIRTPLKNFEAAGWIGASDRHYFVAGGAPPPPARVGPHPHAKTAPPAGSGAAAAHHDPPQPGGLSPRGD